MIEIDVVCDVCRKARVRKASIFSSEDARALAMELGWVQRGEKDICPGCQEEDDA